MSDRAPFFGVARGYDTMNVEWIYNYEGVGIVV